MTTTCPVTIDVAHFIDVADEDAPSRGSVTCTPYSPTETDTQFFTEKPIITPYTGPTPVNLALLPGGNGWLVVIEVDGLIYERLVAPQTADPVNLVELPDLDRSTMTPLPSGSPAWLAPIATEAARAEAAETANANGLAAHLNDTTDAHDASAISFTPGGTVSSTDVQGAIAELASDEGGFVPTTRTVNGHALSGNVAVTPDDLDDSSTAHKFVTAAEKTKLSNLSGTNSGDQDLSGLLAKASNLSDLSNPATARTNLGVPGAALVQALIFGGN